MHGSVIVPTYSPCQQPCSNAAGDRELAACTFSPVISDASRHLLKENEQLQRNFLARQTLFTEARR